MKHIRIKKQGHPWRSSDQDTTLPVQGVWVPPLVRELRSLKPPGLAKNRKKERKEGKKKERK